MRRKVIVALVAVAVVFAAVYGGPFGSKANYSSVSAQASPAFQFWFVFVGQTSCSLTTGICATTIANTGSNSSYDLAVQNSCYMGIVVSSSAQVTTYGSLKGNASGFPANRLPAGSIVTATCTLPLAGLKLEQTGSAATGSFNMSLVNNLGSLPAGKSQTVRFEGIWSASAPSVFTSSTTLSVTSFLVSVVSTTVSTTTTTSTTTIVESSPYSYFLLPAVLIVAIPVLAFLLVRRGSAPNIMRTTAVVVLVILMIGSVFGAYYLNTSTALANQEQTISGLQSTVSSLVSHPVTPATTVTTTAMATSLATTTLTNTIYRFPYVPWDSNARPVWYIQNSSNHCSGGGICLTGDLHEAYLFTCTKAAASVQGCTVQINATDSIAFFQVTVWNPYINQTIDAAAPWANCAFSNTRQNPDNKQPAYCLAIGGSVFVVAIQGPGPT